MTRPAPSLSMRIDFAAGRLGPGKVALLEAIGRLRSLAAAARDLGMSYKRAWELLTVLNAMFDEPVAVAHPGRNRDGSTDLTPFGARVVALYRAVERRANRAAQAGLDELGAAARRESPRATRARRSPPQAVPPATPRARAQAPAPRRRARPT
jgi:molybdate transport system regulatory protein